MKSDFQVQGWTAAHSTKTCSHTVPYLGNELPILVPATVANSSLFVGFSETEPKRTEETIEVAKHLLALMTLMKITSLNILSFCKINLYSRYN